MRKLRTGALCGFILLTTMTAAVAAEAQDLCSHFGAPSSGPSMQRGRHLLAGVLVQRVSINRNPVLRLVPFGRPFDTLIVDKIQWVRGGLTD